MNKYKISFQKDTQVHSIIIETNDLNSQTLPSNIIDITIINKKFFNNINLSNKIKDKELILVFYELSLMLESGILLDDAINILIKNRKNQNIIKFLNIIKNSFSKNQAISKHFDEFKINHLVKSFFKISQNYGNITKNIQALHILLKDEYQAKQEFIKSISYPIVLLLCFISSLFVIFNFVVPKFEFLLVENSITLSFATQILFSVQNILENYTHIILFIFIFLFSIFIYIYKKNKTFELLIDKIFIKNLFILSDIYKIKNLYRYFLLLSLLLENKNEFYTCIVQAKVIIKNKYLLNKINKIDNLIKSGNSISFAFKNVNLFDDMMLNLINTGEHSNNINKIINEIKNIYKKRLDDKLKLLSLLISPIFFILIMSLIVWLIVAIFVPIWSMSSIINI